MIDTHPVHSQARNENVIVTTDSTLKSPKGNGGSGGERLMIVYSIGPRSKETSVYAVYSNCVVPVPNLLLCIPAVVDFWCTWYIYSISGIRARNPPGPPSLPPSLERTCCSVHLVCRNTMRVISCCDRLTTIRCLNSQHASQRGGRQTIVVWIRVQGRPFSLVFFHFLKVRACFETTFSFVSRECLMKKRYNSAQCCELLAFHGEETVRHVVSDRIQVADRPVTKVGILFKPWPWMCRASYLSIDRPTSQHVAHNLAPFYYCRHFPTQIPSGWGSCTKL